jgi:hypothetical protein
MLRGLGQKGTGAGTGACHSPVMDIQRSRRPESTSPMRVTLAERGKPGLLLEREEGRKANRWRGGYGGGKKRTPFCHGSDMGGNLPQRASGLTSLRCLSTRITEESVEKGMQMAVDVFPWCSLPRKGIDFCLVACSQQV